LIFPCHRCHLGGMMYDLWESLLLESEIESKVNEKIKKIDYQLK
jgi:hypothetical protein